MKCPNCGYREEDDALVCSRCGKVLKETGDVLSEEREQEVKQAKAQTGRRNAIIAAIAVVVVAAGGFTTYKLIVGPPVQLVGAWTDTGYGGLLALLSGGVKLQVTSEQGSVFQGNLSDNNAVQKITKGRVNGKHVSATTQGPNSYIYYTFVGSMNSNQQLVGAVTEYNTDVTPTSKNATSVTLVKANTSG